MGSKRAHFTCLCTPNGLGSFLEKHIFDPFLTRFVSQNNPSSLLQKMAVGGWWQLAAVGGSWWLAIGGGWWLVVGGGWKRLAVGGWRLVVSSP